MSLLAKVVCVFWRLPSKLAEEDRKQGRAVEHGLKSRVELGSFYRGSSPQLATKRSDVSCRPRVRRRSICLQGRLRSRFQQVKGSMVFWTSYQALWFGRVPGRVPRWLDYVSEDVVSSSLANADL